jgi:excisionase family DNA binding protein
MSSNIRIQRICEYCNKEFTARTTKTKTCSDNCAKILYKQKQREAKIETSNIETQVIKAKPLEDIKAKEFLTVRDVSKLLNCSVRTVYNYIESGNIKAVNLSQRVTRVKRSEIDKIFS